MSVPAAGTCGAGASELASSAAAAALRAEAATGWGVARGSVSTHHSRPASASATTVSSAGVCQRVAPGVRAARGMRVRSGRAAGAALA